MILEILDDSHSIEDRGHCTHDVDMGRACSHATLSWAMYIVLFRFAPIFAEYIYFTTLSSFAKVYPHPFLRFNFPLKFPVLAEVPI